MFRMLLSWVALILIFLGGAVVGYQVAGVWQWWPVRRHLVCVGRVRCRGRQALWVTAFFQVSPNATQARHLMTVPCNPDSDGPRSAGPAMNWCPASQVLKLMRSATVPT